MMKLGFFILISVFLIMYSDCWPNPGDLPDCTSERLMYWHNRLCSMKKRSIAVGEGIRSVGRGRYTTNLFGDPTDGALRRFPSWKAINYEFYGHEYENLNGNEWEDLETASSKWEPHHLRLIQPIVAACCTAGKCSLSKIANSQELCMMK